MSEIIELRKEIILPKDIDIKEMDTEDIIQAATRTKTPKFEIVDFSDDSFNSEEVIEGIDEFKKEIFDIENGFQSVNILNKDIEIALEPHIIKTSDGEDLVKFDNLQVMLGDRGYEMTSWALSQMSTSISIPTAYIRGCMAKDMTELAALNLTSWLRSPHYAEKEMKFRVYDEVIRGFVSSKYNVFSDIDIIKSICDSLPRSTPFAIANKIVTPDFFKLRVIMKEKLNIGGEDITVGFDISNSGVGQSSLKIKLIVYKFACSNGLIIGGGFGNLYSRNHRSLNVDFEFLRTAFSNFNEFRDMIVKYVDHNQKQQLSPEDIETLTSDFSKIITSEKAKEEVLELALNKYGPTRWGWINAITEVAQEYTINTREMLEEYAGRLLLAA